MPDICSGTGDFGSHGIGSSEGSDEPVHWHSLARPFAAPKHKVWM